MKRIYLDNAATSWPKPPVVYDAVDHCAREIGASAGRGAYDSAAEAGRVVARARSAVARLIGAEDARRVVFTGSGTEALNLAIFGLVRPGDHVVTTVCEHNSVLRPLAMLRDSAGVEVDYVGCDATGVVDPGGIAAAIRPSTRLVAVTSASNVTGALQPIDEIGHACRERGVLFLVDAAQSLGEAPLGLGNQPIDLLAAPGHKAVLGPLGTGVLCVGPGVEGRLRPLLHGGTGTRSELESMPEELPERYEAGNLNVPALAGLAAGVGWLDAAADVQRTLTRQLVEQLSALPGLTVYGPPAGKPRAPVVSFNVAGYDPHDVAAVLATRGIECRAGFHCAARMHEALGSDKLGGTVRLSPGRFTTDEEIAVTLRVVDELVSTRG